MEREVTEKEVTEKEVTVRAVIGTEVIEVRQIFKLKISMHLQHHLW